MSFQELNIDDNTINHEESKIMSQPDATLSLFGMRKHMLPALLTRHPMPFSGKGDDIAKLKEVLDDTITKLGYDDIPSPDCEKILFGPDQKIGNNLIKLRRSLKKYEIFMPEFPCLHYRKSKINNVFAAYKHAGILQILQYMRDDHCNEWAKLITAEHIDVATKYMTRVRVYAVRTQNS